MYHRDTLIGALIGAKPMPQFPITDSRRKVLEQIPDYAVVISPYKGTVTIKSGDTVIA